MSKIQQPSGQIKLTNVSIVRLRKGGKRFEIACYKNKVQEYRTGVETNLDDVLQIANIFINVSKGEAAKAQDLQKAFGTTERDEIVQEILTKGELQIGEKEREHDLHSLRKEIATLVAERCVDPATQRPIAVGIIEKAMAEAGFSIRQGKSGKSQVSECIKLLQTSSNLPIQRARMRVRVTLPTEDAQKMVLPEGAGGPSTTAKAPPKAAPAPAKVVEDEAGPTKKAKGKKGRAKGKTKYDDTDSEEEVAPVSKAAAKKARQHELEPAAPKEQNEKRVQLKDLLLEGAEIVEQADTAAGWEATLLIDPGQFRIMNELLQRECKGRGRIDVEVGGVGAGGSN